MKPKVENDGQNIMVTCSVCGTEHTFVYIYYGKYLLNGQEDDSFIVTGGMLYPDWVCRGNTNEKYCHEQAKVNVENI